MARKYVLYLLLGFLIHQFEIGECRLRSLNLKVGVNVKFKQREIESVNGVCITNDCNKIAQDLLKYVDSDKRPCTDFYDFVCGKYMRNDSIPLSWDNLQSFQHMYNLVESNIDHMLESQITPENKINEKEVKKFYDSCMNMTMIESRGAAPLMEFLETYQGWPLLKGNNWNEREVNLSIIMTRLYEQGTNGLFKISLVKDPETMLETIIISQPDAMFPISHYKENSPYYEYVRALGNYITEIGVHLSSETLRSQIRPSSIKIRSLMGAIALCIAKQRQSADSYYRRITLIEYSAHFGNVVFDLQTILKTLLESHAEINNFVKVIIEHPKYMNCLYKALNKKTKREIVDYLFWELIESLTYAMPEVYRDIRDTFNENIDEYYDYTSTKDACLDFLKGNLLEALDAYYARIYMTKETKKRAKDLVRYVKNSFMKLLKADRKMDYETKEMTIKKLRYMRDLIGYPDYFENETFFTDMFSVLKIDSNKSFIENLMTARRIRVNEGWRFINLVYQSRGPRVASVNAHYSNYINVQEITAPMLMPPFYSDNFPMFWNFGALGFTAAHEMSHGFVMSGRNYDEHGNENGWSERSIHYYDIKGACFMEQYNNFVVTQVNRKIDGLQTLSENIADNVGLKLAYSAYVNWLEVNGEEPRLPGFNFTSKQMFFISFGRYFCGKPNNETITDILDGGVHSTSSCRVIGTLRNSVEFAETFQCREGEPMNPTKKCTYW